MARIEVPTRMQTIGIERMIRHMQTVGIERIIRPATCKRSTYATYGKSTLCFVVARIEVPTRTQGLIATSYLFTLELPSLTSNV